MLLQESMETCVMLNKQTESDGYGGYRETWAEGAEFDAAIVLDTSIEARTAAQQGVTALYTFRRVSDGKIFRVTSDGDDKKTPLSATLDMRQVSGEEWRIANG